MTAPPTARRSQSALLFGYDIFISFALGAAPRGSRSYASDLARRLRERDFTVFFSEDEAPVGSKLDDTLRRALHRSRILVVIANRGTLADPRWVRVEVEEFRHRHPNRPIVPISVDKALQDVALRDSAEAWLAFGDKIWVDETAEAGASGLVSDEVVDRVATAPIAFRAAARWRHWVAGVVIFFAVLAVFSTWMGFRARQSAQAEAIAADKARASEGQAREAAVKEAAAASAARAAESDARLQRDDALKQRQRAEEALAATERELLRAQAAELRGLVRRVDTLIAVPSPGASPELLQRERGALVARLERATDELQRRLASEIGYRGGFEFLQRWEGNVGGVMLDSSGATIDPQTYLPFATPEAIRGRYEYLLTPDELIGVLALVGKKGTEASAIWLKHPALCRVRLEPAEVARLVPEVAGQFWLRLVERYPAILASDVTPATQAALLSLAFNGGVNPAVSIPSSPRCPDASLRRSLTPSSTR